MMAKMFYTLEETKAALGKNEEEVKQFVREGRLREFRDGPRLMFKADQVEQLKADMGGGGDVVSLGPSDTGAPIGLVDSRGASGSVIALADSTGSRAGAANPQAAKEETAFADIGLSGTIGGVPSPGKSGPGESALSGTGTGSRGGITVFDVDESQRVDPSAQTAISPGVQDQVNLEGVGSGSGLLDLTRESDDTSLGAVFDELAPGRRGAAAQPETAAGSGAGMAALGEVRAPGTRVLAGPVYVEAADPSAAAFGAMALAGSIIAAFGLFIVGCGVLGFKAGVLESISSNAMMWLGIAVAVVVVFAIGGFLVGKSGSR